MIVTSSTHFIMRAVYNEKIKKLLTRLLSKGTIMCDTNEIRCIFKGKANMILLVIFGIFLIVISGLLMFAPDLLRKFNNCMNKILFEDKSLYRSRIIVPTLILSVGMLLLYTYYRYAS